MWHMFVHVFSATIEYEAKLKHDNKMARVKAEIEGK